jgi:hypothetical protein
MENYDDDEVIVINAAEYVMCGAKIEACICGLPIGHPEDEPHTCYGIEECGGQWFGDEDNFTPIVLPVLKIRTPFTYEYHISKKGEAK